MNILSILRYANTDKIPLLGQQQSANDLRKNEKNAGALNDFVVLIVSTRYCLLKQHFEFLLY